MRGSTTGDREPRAALGDWRTTITPAGSAVNMTEHGAQLWGLTCHKQTSPVDWGRDKSTPVLRGEKGVKHRANSKSHRTKDAAHWRLRDRTVECVDQSIRRKLQSLNALCEIHALNPKQLDVWKSNAPCSQYLEAAL